MLAKAAATAPSITWQQADLATWRPAQPADLIYSNAALHWLTGHERLFPRCWGPSRPGACSPCRCRATSAPSHTSISEAARGGPGARRSSPCSGRRRWPIRTSTTTCLLPRAALDIWETEYLQVLEGDDPVEEWTKGSWLEPLLDALEEPERGHFEASYAALGPRPTRPAPTAARSSRSGACSSWLFEFS